MAAASRYSPIAIAPRIATVIRKFMSSESSRAARTPAGMNLHPPTRAEATNSSEGIRTSFSGSVNSSGPTPANWSASPTANSAADA